MKQEEQLAMRIELASEFGPVLTGRALAADLRESIRSCLAAGDAVILDFAGIEAISPSFADEVFAKLPADVAGRGRVHFENLDDDAAAMARVVVENRALLGS
jgi:hypothetical protein